MSTGDGRRVEGWQLLSMVVVVAGSRLEYKDLLLVYRRLMSQPASTECWAKIRRAFGSECFLRGEKRDRGQRREQRTGWRGNAAKDVVSECSSVVCSVWSVCCMLCVERERARESPVRLACARASTDHHIIIISPWTPSAAPSNTQL